MSIALLNAVWPLRMASSSKVVLLALADRADDGGRCYPSIVDIRERTCLGERTIQDALSDLEHAGALRREFRTGRSTVYTITPEAFKPPQLPHPRKSRTPAVVAGEGCDSRTSTPAAAAPTPAAAAPITIKNRHLNHQKNRPRARSCVEPDGFPEFYAAYPRRVARADAAKAFDKQNLTAADVPRLIAAIDIQSRSLAWTEHGGKFIPYPASWLNGRRWLDESMEQRPSNLPNRLAV